jgi:thymidylate synthase (FAD)
MSTPLNYINRPYDVLGDGKSNLGLVKYAGGDIDVVNSARVSFGQRKDLLDQKDEKLIKYLANNGHTSPFEHVWMTFHIKCPIFVTRQWHRHRTWSYNEVSRRYTSENIEFYVPKVWRGQAGNEDKQQSKGIVELPDDYMIETKICSLEHCRSWESVVREHSEHCLSVYEDMINLGVARELARMVLPQNMYTEFYGSVNLHNLMHFIKLRANAHAQREIQVYAWTMRDLAWQIAPISVEAIEATWNS